MERREREREEVRRKILDAARDLFMTEGYEKVTMRRLAEVIEYSPTVIYSYFEDKDDLLKSLCHSDFSRLLGAFREQGTPDDPVEWIRQLGRAYAAFGLSHPNHYRFMFMMDAKPEHELSEAGLQSYAMLHTAVEKALEAGRFRPGPADTIAQVLWSSLHGVVALLITYRRDQFPGAPPAADLVDQVIDNGIRGFLAR